MTCIAQSAAAKGEQVKDPGQSSPEHGAEPEQPTSTRPREAVLRPVPEEFPTPPPRPAGWNRSRPPAAAPAPSPRRRPLLIALALIAVLALLVLLGASYLLLRTLPEVPAGAPASPAASSAPAPLVLGEVQVRVVSLEQGVESVGAEGSRRRAQGEFVILTVEVANASSAPVTLRDAVTLVDADGTSYAPDRDAGIAHLADSDPYGLVGPGESRLLHAVYDVPVGTSIDRAAVDLSRYPAGGSGELPL